MVARNNILILVVDSDAVSRQRTADIVTAAGYNALQAIDGGSALKAAMERPVDLAILEHNMSPRTGFDFARDVHIKKLDVSMIMLTDDPSTDLLLEASRYEIKQILRKPVDPDRLLQTVFRVLKAAGRNPDALGSAAAAAFSETDLMKRAIALAYQNARGRMGGPFGAVVADQTGRILGEGVNAVSTRCDPTAHAEVTAIRRATEALGKPRLDDCTVYCSSEPTMLGQALIISTGVAKVYYALTHAEVGASRVNEEGILGEIAKPISQRSVPYEQLGRDAALEMVKAWKAQVGKLSD